jgi:hypothetical protein
MTDELPNFMQSGKEYHLSYRPKESIFTEVEIIPDILDALERSKVLISEGAMFFSLVEIHKSTKGQIKMDSYTEE